MIGRLLLLLLLLTLTHCSSPVSDQILSGRFNFSPVIDHHSFAQPNEARIEHLSLDLRVDFERKMLAGFVKIRLAEHNVAKLYLDTKDLDIERVLIDDRLAVFRLHEADPILGRKLEIDIRSNDRFVKVYYRTSPKAAGLQWLEPEQTAGKVRPFLFTQSQPILARTWIPCQDSPRIRFTYDAKITVPKGFMALMSAQNPTSISPTGVYSFRQEIPIPSYLMALVVGEIAFKPIGKRTGVYAEPSMLEKAYYEFFDLEKMLLTAEKLYGRYRWGRYDLMVLPPSFPFGGMENPMLTFVNPTIIAGDRSLVSLVAHELAHSWSGNLVTNATWDDFWINEGFTVYFEYRIMEDVYGRDFSEMLAKISLNELKALLKEMKNNEDTKLKINLKGRDPDEGMTSIAYDKGYFLLRKIEEKVGREKWDAFLRTYFDRFAFQSITTEEFIFYLEKNLLTEQQMREIRLDDWIYGVGLPDNCPEIQSKLMDEAERLADQFAAGQITAKQLSSDWSYAQWVIFFNRLPAPLPVEKLADLDKTFGFSKSKNFEILAEWFKHCISSRYQAAYPFIEQFLLSVGRRKYVRPIYLAMSKIPELRPMAEATYNKARPTYHYITYSAVDEIFTKF